MRAHERHVHHEYTVPAQWLLEMISLFILQIRGRTTVHFPSHFFNLLHVIPAPEHIQANILTPNTRFLVKNLNTRAAMERNTAVYLKC